jgi:hypothetical protein
VHRECARLATGTTVVAAHWRQHVDDDVLVDVFRKGPTESVEVGTGVPGAVRRS